MITVLDLFSGIGGFSLGLERTGGFKTVAFCEIDNYCQRVLHKHWPHVYTHSDIRTLGAKHFEQYPRPDLICGGFPCTDISIAGKQIGLDGERSGLWWEMHRIINELRPSWVLVENVPNLRTKGAAQVIAASEEIDYTVLDPFVVGAWAVGLQQKRQRVWILAYSAGHKIGSVGWRVRGQNSFTTEGWRFGSQTVASEPQPRVGGVASRLSSRVDRFRTLGNSVVPQIPELFGHAILQLDKQFKEAK